MENIVLQDERKEQIKIVGERHTRLYTNIAVYRAGDAAIVAIAIDRIA